MDTFPATKTAVVFIEYQNEFATEGGKLHEAVKPVMESSGMLANSRSVMDAARDKGAKIFHAPIKFSDSYQEVNGRYGILANVKNGGCFTASAWGADFCDSMRPAPNDIIVDGKKGLCGFASTNLEFLLRQNGIEVVALAGFLTNCCVESTMRAAYEKGYTVVTLVDCTAATSAEAQVRDILFYVICDACQEAAVKYNFPMFSLPLTHGEFLQKLSA